MVRSREFGKPENGRRNFPSILLDYPWPTRDLITNDRRKLEMISRSGERGRGRNVGCARR